MKLTQILLIVVCLISNALLAQQDWKTLEKDDFSIKYPADWSDFDIKDYPETLFILLANPDSGEKDGFAESINLVTEDLSNYNIDIKEYGELAINLLKKEFSKIEISKREALKSNLFVIEYSVEYNKLNLAAKQHIWFKDKTAYILSFTTTEQEFDDYNELTEKILSSFILK